ncbi:S26 family signal peptidase [Streptomyces sp. NPDC046261]|uniref:S26 family signal peptidase n=1 Tax=Streptomyces sp. NPDC046261 TaxID=3157200 RepID=UPI0033DA69F5
MTSDITPDAAALRAETALDRARHRSHRSLLVRLALLAAAALLGGASVALFLAGAPAGGALCAAGALLTGLGVLLAVAVGRRLVAVTVDGRSMEPAYRDGDRVLVRRGAPAAVGEVVVVERPPFASPWYEPPLSRQAGAGAIYARQWVIKRVAALPGDPVPPDTLPGAAGEPGARVPAGMVVLLGDNAEHSYDSRQVGCFPAERVLGAVLRTF